MNIQDLQNLEQIVNTSIRDAKETPYMAFLHGLMLAQFEQEFATEILDSVIFHDPDITSHAEWANLSARLADALREALTLSRQTVVGGN